MPKAEIEDVARKFLSRFSVPPFFERMNITYNFILDWHQQLHKTLI